MPFARGYQGTSSSSSNNNGRKGGKKEEEVRIYYHVHRSSGVDASETGPAHPRLLMIMGFGAASFCWQPQLTDLLLHTNPDGSVAPVEVCVMDNRGIGRSSSPADKRCYSTTIMAQDAAAVLDDLGWRGRVHVVGFSMGGMVSVKFASLHPGRTASLSVISSSGGGWQIIPVSLRALRLVFWGWRRRHFPNASHDLAIKFHFAKDMLDETDESDVGSCTRRAILLQEYASMSEVLGKQSDAGFAGQARACWRHRMTRDDVLSIRHAGFPCLVVHGRHDIVAMPWWGRRLAQRLKAPFVLLEGAHFLARDQAVAVNQLIKGVVFGNAFHHRPHYQFVISEAHLTSSYTEELDASPSELEGHAADGQHPCPGSPAAAGCPPSPRPSAKPSSTSPGSGESAWANGDRWGAEQAAPATAANGRGPGEAAAAEDSGGLGAGQISHPRQYM